MKHFLVGIFAAVFLSGFANAQSYSELTDARDALLAGDFDTAFEIIEPAAEGGNPRALNLLGAAFKDGIGRPQDTALALAYFEKAAASNYGPALFNLGLLYETGAPGLERDPGLARDHYLRGVELDYAANMGAFARFMLMEGPGNDMPLVIDALERGVVLGDPKSLLILGILSRLGQGVEADPVRARDLLHAAALLGEPEAMQAMVEMLATEEGGPEDLVTMRRFLRDLAELGDANAQYRMGEIVALGQGVEVDMAEAVRWLEAAAAQGHARANDSMGQTLRNGRNGIPADPVRARSYLARAAELGNPGSFGSYGAMVYLGEGGPADPVFAAQIYADGVVAGDPYSMNNLGEINREGDGVPQNLELARDLYQMAADAGLASGMSNLGVMLQRGFGGPQDLDRALELYLQAGTLGDMLALHNAAMIILEQQDRFAQQQIAGLGLCLWVYDHAQEPFRSRARSECEVHFDRFTDDDVARARLLMESL